MNATPQPPREDLDDLGPEERAFADALADALVLDLRAWLGQAAAEQQDGGSEAA